MGGYPKWRCCFWNGGGGGGVLTALQTMKYIKSILSVKLIPSDIPKI